MAEEVKIVDVAGGPAAEATLQEILKIMKQRGGGGGGGSGEEAAAKAQDLYTTAVTRGTKTSKDNTSAIKDSTGALGAFSSGLSSVGSMVRGVFGAIVGAATNLTSAITNATTIGGVLEAVPIFGGVLGQATGYFQSSIEAFRDLSEVGAGFSGDMLQLRNAAAESGLSLEQFSQMITNNSQTLGLLGGSTSEGAARLGRMTNRLRQADMGLMELGFTQETLNEGMAAYIEMQARSGRLQGQTDAQLVAGAQSYLLELDQLARVTGKSRKELQDEMNQRMQAANFNVLAARLSGQALENFTLNTQHTSSMLGSGFADVMTDLGDGVAQSDFAKTLAASVPGLQDLAEANARGELSQAEYQSRLQALMPTITQFADNMGAAGVQQLQGKAGFAEFMESLANARTYTQRTADANKAAAEQAEARARRDPLTSIFANFEQTIQNVRSTFENALLDSGVLKFVGTQLAGFGETIVKYAGEIGKLFSDYLASEQFKKDFAAFQEGVKNIKERISQFLEKVKTEGLGKAISDLFEGAKANIGEWVGNGIKSMFMAALPSWETILSGLAGVIAGLFLGVVTGPFTLIGAALLGIFGYDKIKELVGGAWDAIKGLGTSIANFFSWENIKSYYSGLWDAITAVPKAIIGVFQGDGSLSNILKSAMDAVFFIPNKILELFNLGSVTEFYSNAWNTVSSIPGKILEFFNLESVGQLFSNAWSTISGIPGKILEFFNVESVGQLFSNAWNTISGIPGKILEFFNIESVGTMFSSAWDTITGIPTKILEFFNLDNLSLPSITELFGGLVDKVKGFFSFDFELPNFNDYLPSWLGGGGKSLSDLFGGGSSSPGTQVAQQVAQPRPAASNAPTTVQTPENLAAFAGLDFRTAQEGVNLLKASLSDIASLQTFNTELERIQNGLDFENVNSYNTAMQRLVETLEELNDVLAEDNKGMFGTGTGVSAASVIGQSNSSGNTMSEDQATKLDQLNITMNQVLIALREGNEYSRRTSRAVAGNLQLGIA